MTSYGRASVSPGMTKQELEQLKIEQESVVSSAKSDIKLLEDAKAAIDDEYFELKKVRDKAANVESELDSSKFKGSRCDDYVRSVQYLHDSIQSDMNALDRSAYAIEHVITTKSNDKLYADQLINYCNLYLKNK